MSVVETIVGLDIGTTKVCSIISEVDEDGVVEIVGVGTSPSHGLRKGVVVNLEETVDSISKAIQDAEVMAGVEVQQVFAGIAGGHIKGGNARGVIAISRSDKEITKQDVEHVIDSAKAICMPMDREVIHVIPQEFTIDDQDGIRDPIGMSGVRLEAEVHIVTGAITSAMNIVKSVNRAGFEVEDIVLEPLASSYAVLTEDEKELGVALVDIGGGTTDLALFLDGSIWHTQVIALGGTNISKDISVCLRTPMNESERIKLSHGCATTELIDPDEEIEVPMVGGRATKAIARQILVEIIESRMEEMFTLISREIKKTGYEELLAAGVVLTGGASSMSGVQELAEKILDLPVRIGNPRGINGLVDVINSPMYATGVGLNLYGKEYRKEHGRPTGLFGGNLFRSVTNRMKLWFGDFFK